MNFRNIWINPRMLHSGQAQVIFTEDPNQNLMVYEEGHEQYVKLTHLREILNDLRYTRKALTDAHKALEHAHSLVANG